MPIEIRELVIRATVDPGEGGHGSAGSCGSSGAKPAGKGQSHSQSDAHSGEHLVQTCVREVLRILEEKRER